MISIWMLDDSLGDAVALLPWIIDGISVQELASLKDFYSIAEGAFDNGTLELAILIVNSAWFVDGVDYDGRHTAERSAIRYLNSIVRKFPGLAAPVSEFAWIADDMTQYEGSAIRYLINVADNDLELAIQAAGAPWVVDGIVRHEMFSLNALVDLADWNPEFARYALNFSVDAPVQNSAVYLIDSLFRLRHREEQFDRLVGQPWFVDGLDAEERAFITVLESRQGDSDLYDDMLRSRYTQSGTITLPLAADVNLWAFETTPFPPNEDLLMMIEDAVLGAEKFMGAPFPTNDVIVFVVDESRRIGGFAGFHGETHVLFARSDGAPVSGELVYHEIAHYYITIGIGPIWLMEGGAEFITAYIKDRLGIESLEEQLVVSTRHAQQSCVEHGIENIHALEALDPPEQSRWLSCNYSLGRHFIMSLFNTLGEAPVSSALRELYLRSRIVEDDPTEEEIYKVFLKHAPPDLMDEFLDLYRLLHGGPFTDSDN